MFLDAYIVAPSITTLNVTRMTRSDSPRGSFQSPVRAVLQAQCPAAPVKRRPHKYRPGTKALREIRYEQSQTDLKIPRSCFKRLVYEILNNELDSRRNSRRFYYSGAAAFSNLAIDALQSASETYLVEIFHDSQLNAIHANRQEINVEDIRLANYYANK